MSATVAELRKGHQFPVVDFALSREWVSAYVDAVADVAVAEMGSDAVPPMAIAALSIRALLQHAELAPGAIHVGQDVSFQRMMTVGDSLSVTATVASRGERGGWVLMGIDFVASGPSGKVMAGRATITYPVGETT